MCSGWQMRIFTLAGLSTSNPINILVIDDSLELPGNLNNLRVYFLIKHTNSTLQYYQVGGALVCFINKEDAAWVDCGFLVGWRAVLDFFVLLCQREKIGRIVIK